MKQAMVSSNPDKESTNSAIAFLSRVGYYLKPAILPVLLALIPTLYHYSNNVAKLTSASLYRMLIFNALVAIIVYVICLIFTRFHTYRAAIASSIFLVFFNIYGVVYRYLLHLDVIQIKNYTLLPLTILLAIYAMIFLTRWKVSVLNKLWGNLLLITSVLVLFNLIAIVPAELKKSKSDTAAQSLIVGQQVSADKKSPDIYYIILDEFEGLQGMREYWKYQGVDDFANFLKNRNFFVAEASHATKADTLYEMASRLNYEEYPQDEQDLQFYFDAIADNRVMKYLKSKGYTTVVFDETKLGYTSAKSIQADYLYEYGTRSIPHGQVGKYAFYFDEFGELVIDNTMLYVISREYKSNNALINNHTNMISFTLDNIVDEKVPSPKFVYVHLLLPHAPFIYNETGAIVDSDHFTNWNYYIDNYKFSINVAERMVDKILQEADPKNPPVIILQSDHGARNHLAHDENSMILQNYPENLKTLILYTLYLPGYDTSHLPQDINPTNTFPIIFNHLFDAGIPLLN
jgi:sulfatase-like protein